MKIEDITGRRTRVCCSVDGPHDYARSYLVWDFDGNLVWLVGPGDSAGVVFAKPDELVPYVGRPRLTLVP